jgi:hypothetical protein
MHMPFVHDDDDDFPPLSTQTPAPRRPEPALRRGPYTDLVTLSLTDDELDRWRRRGAFTWLRRALDATPYPQE